MTKITFKRKMGWMVFALLVFCLGQIMAAACGDVNSSGKVDIVDALMTAQYYVGLNPPNFDPAVADVDGTGVVDIVDALRIAQYYVDPTNLLSGCPTSEPTPTPEGNGPPELIGWLL